MKFLKSLSFIILAVLTLSLFTSCDIIHQHKWQYYLVKAPTCSEVGIIKSICLDCGEMELNEITKQAHDFYNGKCTVCGTGENEVGSITRIPLPTDVSHVNACDLSEIYSIACTLGCEVDYETFIAKLTENEIRLFNPSLNVFGSFSVMGSIKDKNGVFVQVPLTIPLDRLPILNPESSFGSIIRMDIENGNIVITYSDGIQVEVGTLNTSVNAHIEGFGINGQNQLIFYYSDNTIAYVGTLKN